jgi:hypothetical protein
MSEMLESYMPHTKFDKYLHWYNIYIVCTLLTLQYTRIHGDIILFLNL